MGYRMRSNPSDDSKNSGPRFAGRNGGIRPGDVILIARGHKTPVDLAGFGVVRGGASREHFVINGTSGTATVRKLSRFIQLNSIPRGIPLMGCLRHTIALAQLHPERSESHKIVCMWLARRLRLTQPTKTQVSEIARIIAQSDKPKRNYKFRTGARVGFADQAEARLVASYKLYLKNLNRNLRNVRYFGNLTCDGYEKSRKNLIEAKSSRNREKIRMAVGQLLDYDYLGRNKYGGANLAILLPKRPDKQIEKWLKTLQISVIWSRRDNTFDDNANKRFT